ncbi:MAG: amino acid-binding protein [Zetaproteobacteria bacterium]|nr:MAG: amino acid-binding protein [Zetaproteobacteria bacterium]
MSHALLSISGRDRAGIVRDVAEAMLHLEANIEDSSMTALRGRFTMMLIVRLPRKVSLVDLNAALAELEQRSGLTIQAQPLSEDEVAVEGLEPDCVITVHGGDRMGIVYEVSRVLAEHDVSIVDLSTQLRGRDVYLMVLEAHAGAKVDTLRRALAAASEKLGVDIEVHRLDTDVL